MADEHVLGKTRGKHTSYSVEGRTSLIAMSMPRYDPIERPSAASHVVA